DTTGPHPRDDHAMTLISPDSDSDRGPDDAPAPVPARPPGNSDVCALGHKYGGWGRDTPQAAICRDVYGR
ncbi:hypothetical protein PV727_30020, partial [Streptomyces scabiei]|nr:hypothetical protein [Streptomyces scabiei]